MRNDTAQALADFLLPQLRSESATTRKVLAAVPAETCDYKPDEKCMSALQLAIHLASAEAFFLNGVINGAFEWKQPDLKTPADVVAYYDATIPALLDRVASLPPEKLAQPLEFAGMNDGAVTFLSICLKHGIHHRGQLSTYLRPMGGKVPSIYGPTADEPRQAAASE